MAALRVQQVQQLLLLQQQRARPPFQQLLAAPVPAAGSRPMAVALGRCDAWQAQTTAGS